MACFRLHKDLMRESGHELYHISIEKTGAVMKTRRFSFVLPFVMVFTLLCLGIFNGCGDDSTGPKSDDSQDPVETLLTISGKVYYSDTVFMGASVFLTVNGELRATTTDKDGAYSYDTISPGDSCFVNYVHDGFRFEPPSLSFVVGDSSVVLENITAFMLQTIDIDVTLVPIPGGTFEMGSNFEDSPDNPHLYNLYFTNEQPIHTVTVGDFEMSPTEITEDQFARFLTNAYEHDLITFTLDYGEDATGLNVLAKTGTYAGRRLLGHGYIGSVHGYTTAGPHNHIRFTAGLFSGPADIPVKDVTWYGAKMFAEFVGCDLPTEAEWEYACRGGKGYDYGTDDGTIDLSKVNYQPVEGPPAYDPRLTVGLYPPNPFGIYDLTGNVLEWCNDFYDGDYYAVSPSVNPTGPASGVSNVVRGGGYGSQAYVCRASYRTAQVTESHRNYIGFRVVRRK